MDEQQMSTSSAPLQQLNMPASYWWSAAEYYCWPIATVVLVIVSLLTFRYLIELFVIPALSTRPVFITGCDSGFGRELTRRLIELGIPVFAGCYTDKGEDELRAESDRLLQCGGELHPIRIDITDEQSVADALDSVMHLLDGRALWAVVNNAGIFSIYGPDCWLSLNEYRQSIDVNLFGAIRVCHAFVPLIKRSRGRIVTMTSVSGRLPGFFTGPYTTAKYALEGYMDVLRLELHQFGVSVHILEPGAFATSLLDKRAQDLRVEQIWSRLASTVRQEYGILYKENFKEAWAKGVQLVASNNIHYVVDNYVHAIIAQWPRARYHCGWDAILVWIPLSLMPTMLQDYIIRFLTQYQPGPPLMPVALQN